MRSMYVVMKMYHLRSVDMGRRPINQHNNSYKLYRVAADPTGPVRRLQTLKYLS